MKPGGKYNEPASVPTAVVEEWAAFLATQGAGSFWACPVFGFVTASSSRVRVSGLCVPLRRVSSATRDAEHAPRSDATHCIQNTRWCDAESLPKLAVSKLRRRPYAEA